MRVCGALVFHRHYHYVLVISSPLICPPYALDTISFWYLRTETNSRNPLDIRLMPSLHEREHSHQGPRTGTADKTVLGPMSKSTCLEQHHLQS